MCICIKKSEVNRLKRENVYVHLHTKNMILKMLFDSISHRNDSACRNLLQLRARIPIECIPFIYDTIYIRFVTHQSFFCVCVCLNLHERKCAFSDFWTKHTNCVKIIFRQSQISNESFELKCTCSCIILFCFECIRDH